MRDVLRNATDLGRIPAAGQVMDQLRIGVMDAVDTALDRGLEVGDRLAVNNFAIYGIPSPVAIDSIKAASTKNSVMDSVSSQIDRQRSYGLALIVSESEDAELIGDESQPGIFNPSQVVRDTDHWAASLAAMMFVMLLTGGLQMLGPEAPILNKAAIAVIDKVTTETCIKVDGQVQALDEPFDLDGWQPAFSDEMMFPPFHHFCRTGIALALPEDVPLLERAQGGAAIAQREM
jgi:hypothetical protein